MMSSTSYPSPAAREEASVLLVMMMIVAGLSFAAGYLYHGHRDRVRRADASEEVTPRSDAPVGLDPKLRSKAGHLAR